MAKTFMQMVVSTPSVLGSLDAEPDELSSRGLTMCDASHSFST